jgi:hypothetical protein
MGYAARANKNGRKGQPQFVPYKVSAAAAMELVETSNGFRKDEPDWDGFLQTLVQKTWKGVNMETAPTNTVAMAVCGTGSTREEQEQFIERCQHDGIPDAQPVLLLGKFPDGNQARFVTHAECEYLTKTKGSDEDTILWTMPPRQSVNLMPEHSTIQ